MYVLLCMKARTSPGSQANLHFAPSHMQQTIDTLRAHFLVPRCIPSRITQFNKCKHLTRNERCN